MSKTSRYCRRCEQRFAVEHDEPRCPQCGDKLSAWVDTPTMELSEVSFDASMREDLEPPEELVGSQLANYRIERFLGQGGMARVYLATHLTLERPCAIKVLRPATLERDGQAAETFLAEARSAAALTHPHVVTLYTIGQEGDRQFLEMEYVDGQSLGCLLEQHGHMDPLRATQFMLQVSSALAAAHDLGMIHRDIKPANVMVTRAGTAKLADFGLAKRLSTKGPVPGGLLCGTPHYMAPELFMGHPATTRSDIYAMGVTFFSLLVGRLPLETESMNELIRFHARNDILDSASFGDDLPAGIARVLQKALARSIHARHEHAGELHEELRAVLGGLRSLESLLVEAFAGSELQPRCEGGRCTIAVPLQNGRFQTVHVEIDKDAETRDEIVRVFSVCGATSACYYERALHLNAAISHGAIGIETVEGVPHFVMVNAYPRTTCDPHEIRTSVLEIARHSDQVEHLLTGEDQF